MMFPIGLGPSVDYTIKVLAIPLGERHRETRALDTVSGKLETRTDVRIFQVHFLIGTDFAVGGKNAISWAPIRTPHI